MKRLPASIPLLVAAVVVLPGVWSLAGVLTRPFEPANPRYEALPAAIVRQPASAPPERSRIEQAWGLSAPAVSQAVPKPSARTETVPDSKSQGEALVYTGRGRLDQKTVYFFTGQTSGTLYAASDERSERIHFVYTSGTARVEGETTWHAVNGEAP